MLRAAATVVEDGDILVVGSQAILGTYEADELPEEATMSVEADVAFWDDPDETKADRVDGAIGEYSLFHQSGVSHFSSLIRPDVGTDLTRGLVTAPANDRLPRRWTARVPRSP